MRFLLSIIPFLALCMYSSDVLTLSIPSGEITPNLEAIGTVGGITYYAELPGGRLARSWTQAKTYCESKNMTLGEVRTVAQFNLLNGVRDTIWRGQRYWTGARDSHRFSQMLWDGSESVTSESFIAWEVNKGQRFYTCAFLNIPWAFTDNATMELYSCEFGAGVLCQV